MGKHDESAMDTSVVEVGAPSTDKDVYAEQCSLVNAIASPLASRKLAKKVYKLMKKASGAGKGHMLQGIVEVHRAIRKKEKGIVILAGNVTPVDVYSHVPALCEDMDLPYVFLPSRESLGIAAGHRRAAILLLIKPGDSYQELYDELHEEVNLLVPTPN